MRIAFRVDASDRIGSGHVMRCLTLAESLRLAGADTLFVCREHKGHLADWVRAEGHTTILLPARKRLPGTERLYADWLGDDVAADAGDTLSAIVDSGGNPDWIVTDHYAINSEWEARFRTINCNIMAIDDLANRPHDCDILLDQNFIVDFRTRYAGLVNAATKQLLGPKYALLQSAYTTAHRHFRPQEPPYRLLCYFGASDFHGLTLSVVEAICELGRRDILADIVLGPNTPQLEAIRALAETNKNITVHSKLPSLVSLMSGAHLAIGSAGATSWERLCLGVPAVVVTQAENQRPIAKSLHDHNLAIWLGDSQTLDATRFKAALTQYLRPGGTSWFNEEVARLVDGNGAQRVVSTMLSQRL